MSIVTLVSGGLDSTLVAYLAKAEGVTQFPLFIDYGQRARDRELAACKRAMERLDLSPPAIAPLAGFGALIRSGLTDSSLRVLEDAFTPGRNLLFLLTAAAYAFQQGADAVSIGLLHEDTTIFPDQRPPFLRDAQRLISQALGRDIRVLTPLANFHKIDVVALAKEYGIADTYSCHVGGAEPCGNCIACNEFKFEER